MSIGSESAFRNTAPQEHAPEARGTRRLVSPFRCRVWTQHSRPEEHLTDSACSSLRESIEKHGQHQPALGRPVNNDPDYDIEIICGARRHAAAQALGRDFLVEVRPMTDAEAYVAMYEENLLREEDSPYVRGKILFRALQSEAYTSQEELGRAFNLSHSAVSRLLMLAQLPTIIVGAFNSPDEIRESWGVELFRLWSTHDKHDEIVARARVSARTLPRPSAHTIYESLITAQGGRKRPARRHIDVPIRGSSNIILFHEQDQLEKVVYSIPKAILSPRRRQALKQSIVRVLEEEPAVPPLLGPTGAPQPPKRRP